MDPINCTANAGGEMPRPSYALALGAITLGALALRLWHIDFGLPEPWHMDEFDKVPAVRNLMALHMPGYLKHPGLMLNMVAAACRLASAIGRELSADMGVVLVGRLVVAMTGTLTVLPAAALGRRLGGGAMAGLVSAAGMAVCPIHVVHSRYLKEDVHLTLFAMLSVWLACRMLDDRGTAKAAKWFFASCACAGAAVASKYAGAYFIAVVIVAGLVARLSLLRCILPGIALCVAVFILLSPQLVIDRVAANRDIAAEFDNGTEAIGDRRLEWNDWPDFGTFYFRDAVGWGLGWTLVPASLLGLWLAMRPGSGASRGMRLTALAALGWYLLIELSPRKRAVDVERYAIPAIALLVPVAAAVLARWSAALARRSPQLACALPWILLLFPLGHTIAIGVAIEPDTRELAARWLLDQAKGRESVDLAMLGGTSDSPDKTELAGSAVHLARYKRLSSTGRNLIADHDAMLTSSFVTARYDDYPHLSKSIGKRLNSLRADFPHEIFFRKSRWVAVGFHNPTVEIRWKDGYFTEK